MCDTFSFKTCLLSLGVWTLHPDYGTRRLPPRPASLDPVSSRGVPLFPPCPSTETCLPAQEGIDLLCSQSWLFCLAEGHINFPVQTRSRARSKCPGWVHGRNEICAFKQEHDIPLMLPSHVMCARSMSSTTSANFPKFLNLNFCLASKIRSE